MEPTSYAEHERACVGLRDGFAAYTASALGYLRLRESKMLAGRSDAVQ